MILRRMIKAKYIFISSIIISAVLLGMFGCAEETSSSEDKSDTESAMEYYHIIFHRNYTVDDVTAAVIIFIL